MGLWLNEDGGRLDDEAANPLLNEATLPVFPAKVLGITVELLVNGTWTNITGYVQQRADITISHGRPNEASQIQPASMTLTLNNRDGSFSPKNAAGQFYPYIGRNTQVRLSVASQSGNAVAYSGYRFWGEVSQWPPQWDKTGNDVYVQVQAAGVLRRYIQGGLIGSALKRYYLLKTDATAPIAMWTCEDQTGATQFTSALASGGTAMTWTGTPGLASDTSFAGTDPLPLVSKSVWTGNTGSYSVSGPVTYTTPGTYTFTCPGGVTSLTSAECWGGGGGGSNGWGSGESSPGQPGLGGTGGGGGEYAKEASVAVTPGNSYTVTVGSGGEGGELDTNGVAFAGNGGSASSFTGDAVTVTAHGGGGGPSAGTTAAAGGTGSGDVTHFNGGAGGINTNINSTGGAGGGSSGGSASAGNAGGATSGGTGGSGGAAVTGGGKGGSGGAGGAGQDHSGNPGSVPGGGGGGGGLNTNNFAAHSGGNGASGQVKLSFTSSSTPNNVVVRFLLSIPATGCVDGATIARAVVASGTLSKVECYYGKGGKLGFRGFNTVPAVVFDSGLLLLNGGGGVDGVPVMISLELAKSGTAIAWNLSGVTPGGVVLSAAGSSGTLASATMGAVSQVVINPGGTVNDTAVGLIVLQYALEALTAVYQAIGGFANERAATRLSRLAAEEGFGFAFFGSASDTALMGPQLDAKFMDLLQQCEDADQGLLYETRDAFGIGYRSRVLMQNQNPGVLLDYSAAMLSDVPLPQYDDSLTRNDVTVSRINGGSVNAQLTTGALSVQAPPNGVGDYGYSLPLNLFSDAILAQVAAWILAIGTVDEYRFPAVPLDLSRTEVQSLFAAIPSLGIGDYFQIINPPSWVPSSPVKQLLWGYAETLNAFTWRITENAVPESPWETALNANILAYSSSTTGWAADSSGTFSVTGSPPAGALYPWAGKYVNGGVSAGAMKESAVPFAAVPTVRYHVTATKLYVTSGSVQLGFDWTDSGGTLLSTDTVTATPTPNTWFELGWAATAPANAAHGVPRVGTSTASGATVYAQHVVAALDSLYW